MTGAGKEFYTVRGYELIKQAENVLTPSMEDYLEMAYRLSLRKEFVRISDLAEALNVQPSSATKMVQKLADMGFFKYEKYGVIEFTDIGNETGRYLLKRHETIENFLYLIGVRQCLLEDTEKIEHNISAETYSQISLLTEFLLINPSFLERFEAFIKAPRPE
ncbi:MAG TPA: DtxR family transcriptional regulator [Firmicutes bacterium]|nr:DtxR family transcriptional regulator [Bacillota bacterium]